MALSPLPSDQQDFVSRARDFAIRVVGPNAAAWDARPGGLPREIIDEWGASGLNALQVSRGAGGLGAGFLCKVQVAEALASECFAAAFALMVMQGSVTRMEREGSPAQIERYLPGLLRGSEIGSPSLTEPHAGSDFGAIASRATKTAGGWVLNGEKAWVTNAGLATHLVMYAQTDPGSGARGIASFIVDLDAPGITRHAPEMLVGGNAIGAARVGLNGVRVADAALFAPPGEAFKRALRSITSARVHVAAMICAATGSALRLAVDHAGNRRSFGLPLLGHQGLRWQLVDVATELEAARLLVARAAEIVDSGRDAQIEAALAKKYAAEMAGRAIPACMQAMGAEALRAAHPLGRHLAAARIAAYVDGTTEIQTERIGAVLAARYGTPAS